MEKKACPPFFPEILKCSRYPLFSLTPLYKLFLKENFDISKTTYFQNRETFYYHQCGKSRKLLDVPCWLKKSNQICGWILSHGTRVYSQILVKKKSLFVILWRKRISQLNKILLFWATWFIFVTFKTQQLSYNSCNSLHSLKLKHWQNTILWKELLIFKHLGRISERFFSLITIWHLLIPSNISTQ